MYENTAENVSENITVKKEKLPDHKKWHKQDTTWALSLFGTAIGAGVLFLPINAGIGGIISLLFITILAYPVMYYGHRAFAKIIYSSKVVDEGITGTIREYFGNKASKIFNLIYFLIIYIIMLLYAVAITNTISSFMVNQLHLNEPPRVILSLVIVLGLIAIVNFGQEITIKVMSMLVYPFIASLIFIGIYLIPQWNMSILDVSNISVASTGQGIIGMLWMTFPIMVLSFNHIPIISPFVKKQKETYGEEATDAKCAQIQKYGYILIFTVVMFFVYSSVLSLSPQDLALAKEQNLSILSYLANHLNIPTINYIAPLIAFIAIVKSFLGHYVGGYEVMRDMILESSRARGKELSEKAVKTSILIFMVLTGWYAAYANPSILGMMESIAGPIGAALLCILPMYAIRKVPALAKYKGKLSNVFVTVVGVITVLALFKTFF
ncbi:aromatic amino acid transport family protein [Peribacillus frigoritolerans]|uniref:aromatic amino acid transport family protein n=1 Tax=Peribacillus frigoritolerans TaxID=450367 RepID=UPI003D04AF1A